MRRFAAVLMALALAASSAMADAALERLKALRREQRDEKDRLTILYQFEPGGEYLSPAAQAVRNGYAAAQAWKLFDRSTTALPVVARSPYGGGETAKSYWPAEVKPELLRNLGEPLGKLGIKAVFPELPAEKPEAQEPPAQPAKPWPTVGFPEDHEFVLLVGMHHEPIPYLGERSAVDRQAVQASGSRMNGWAILFHVATGTAFWATTAVARVGQRGVEDPLNLAAETVLRYLDLDDLGADNIPPQIERLAAFKDLQVVDLAAMLVQTQRADAVEAVIKLAMSKPAYLMKPRVLRFFNDSGTAQDYRIEPEQARAAKYAYASQLVTVRVLLMEQLRGMRSVQACSAAALVPKDEDWEMGPLGGSLAGRLQPLGGLDEILLITELAHSDPQSLFRRNYAAAVRNLGKCRTHDEEAMAVARFYAERPVAPPRGGRPARQDPLKEAGKAALTELQQVRAEKLKKRAAAAD